MSRRDALRLLFVLAPLVLLGAGARCMGPALAGWKRQRIAGDRYALTTRQRGSWTFEVTADRRLNDTWIEALVNETARFLKASTDSRSLFRWKPPQGQVRLLVFENDDDFLVYAGTRFGAILENSSGCYSRVTHEIALIHGGGEVRTLFPGLRHEATHLLVDRSAGDDGISPWLDEGLASWSEMHGPGAARDDGLLVNAIGIVQAERSLDLERSVLEAPARAFLEKDNARSYELSAALVTYLLEGAGQARKAAFVRHVHAECEGTSRGAMALAQDLDTTVERLEEDLAAWLAKGAPRAGSGSEAPEEASPGAEAPGPVTELRAPPAQPEAPTSPAAPR